MKTWLAGTNRMQGGAAIDIYKDSIRGKWFDKKSITIPKGTKVYIHPDKVVMLVKAANAPDSTYGNANWRFVYYFKDKTLSTSSLYSIWKDQYVRMINAGPSFEEKAEELDVYMPYYVSPKYKNDELIGFLRTLNPKLRAAKEQLASLTPAEKQIIDKNWKELLEIKDGFIEFFQKNPQKYLKDFKGGWGGPSREDLRNAHDYIYDAIKAAYGKTFDRLINFDKYMKSKSSPAYYGYKQQIQKSAKVLDEVQRNMQQHISDLYMNRPNPTSGSWTITLNHPYDSKRNIKFGINFTYLD
jgi:hypothetical protein